MTDEKGHFECSFALAKMLRRAGHQITYFGPKYDCDYVTKRGFDYEVLDSGEDETIQVAEAKSSKRPGFFARVRHLLAESASDVADVSRLLNEALTFARYGWDLLICDELNPLGAFIATRAGIKCMLLQTTLPRSRRLPPWSSGLIPEPTLPSLVRTHLAWKHNDLREALRLDGVFLRWRRLDLRSVAQRFGVPATRRRGRLYDFEMNLTTIIACPGAFDFPRALTAREHYVEPLVDVEREEEPFEWDRLTPHKKLVYVSMGSQSWIMRDAADFFRRVVAAAALRPQWQWLVNVGAWLAPSELTHVPPNVLLVTSAPQLAVLSRAAVMVTHGGLNSTKECILRGVPMVVLPVGRDQPSIAARIVHHGIGLRGDYRRVSAQLLASLVDEVLTHYTYRMCITRMQDEFMRAQSSGSALRIIEQVLSS